ncbi:MAG: kinase [Candidatus Saccharibacteria bacterium]|nr:kinase [Candidatus Saccharibacteria bacterium]
MIITKTPFRMSFFGGGTDMKDYFEKNGGAVLSTTIDKYCYVTIRHLPRFFDYATELAYSRMERVKSNDEIEHPLIRNAMNMMDLHNLRLTYEADLPARSGLGTSSSFAVGMLQAFHAMKHEEADKKMLADEAIYLERTLCDEAGGWQDQIAAAFGGFNKIVFSSDGYEVMPVTMAPNRKDELNNNILMFFTGFTRNSSEIQKINNETSIEDKNIILKRMLEMVSEAEDILMDETSDLDNFGKLLHESWNLKRKTGKAITNSGIDALYEKGMNAGALGGKLLGAGGGGFLIFYVQPDRQDAVKKALSDLMYIPFKFENDGATIIHASPETNEFDVKRDS